MKLYKAYIQACIQPGVLLYGTAAQKKQKNLNCHKIEHLEKVLCSKDKVLFKKNKKSVLLKIFSRTNKNFFKVIRNELNTALYDECISQNELCNLIREPSQNFENEKSKDKSKEKTLFVRVRVLFNCLSRLDFLLLVKIINFRGGFRGGGAGGGGGRPPPSGIRPPADPKGPPFGTF